MWHFTEKIKSFPVKTVKINKFLRIEVDQTTDLISYVLIARNDGYSDDSAPNSEKRDGKHSECNHP